VTAGRHRRGGAHGRMLCAAPHRSSRLLSVPRAVFL
jgi:hypothetical protein